MLSNLCYTLRSLGHSPAYVTTAALGIRSNAAIFTVMYRVLLRTLEAARAPVVSTDLMQALRNE